MNPKLKKIADFVSLRNLSLIHKDTFISLPVKNKGILYWVSEYIPVSYQGTLGRSLLKKNREKLIQKKESWKNQISKIWNKELEIIIIYKLGGKYNNCDVDNLNKYMVDSMKGILFKDDSQIKLIVGRKDKINETYLRGKFVEKAIVRIELFEKSKINKLLNKIFKNPYTERLLKK